jgi:hypothetical protein
VAETERAGQQHGIQKFRHLRGRLAPLAPGLFLPLRVVKGRAAVSPASSGHTVGMASYSVNPAGVAWAEHLIDAGQYVLTSDWAR